MGVLEGLVAGVMVLSAVCLAVSADARSLRRERPEGEFDAGGFVGAHGLHR